MCIRDRCRARALAGVRRGGDRRGAVPAGRDRRGGGVCLPPGPRDRRRRAEGGGRRARRPLRVRGAPGSRARRSAATPRRLRADRRQRATARPAAFHVRRHFPVSRRQPGIRRRQRLLPCRPAVPPGPGAGFRPRQAVRRDDRERADPGRPSRPPRRGQRVRAGQAGRRRAGEVRLRPVGHDGGQSGQRPPHRRARVLPRAAVGRRACGEPDFRAQSWRRARGGAVRPGIEGADPSPDVPVDEDGAPPRRAPQKDGGRLGLGRRP